MFVWYHNNSIVMFVIVLLITNCCIDKIESDLNYIVEKSRLLLKRVTTHHSEGRSPFAIQIDVLGRLRPFLL